MKEELKTEDIVGYLPYGLKLWHKEWKEELIMDYCGNGSNTLSIEDVCEYAYPILIPLHSLTKEQLVHFSICFRLWYDKPNFDYKLMIYQDIETCHKLHVDYRGLIEKGLAIKK